jgi:HK97 family phage portal protein
VNIFQKALVNIARKALGFPVWTGGSTDVLPGGWGSLEYGNTGYPQASGIAAVYGCWRVLCQTIGSVPWRIYKTDKSGTRIKAEDHPLYSILHDSPNAYMTSMEFREALILGFCSTGNGYAERVTLGGRLVGLSPLRADRVIPLMKNGNYGVIPGPGLIYRYTSLVGDVRDYLPGEIIHLKNFSLDGIRGISPLAVHAIQHSMYTDAYATNFMRNQGRPSGVLESKKPRPKDPDFNDRLSADWKKLYGGDNAGSTAVLWDEMTYKAISISPNDAQYIETKKLNALDICGIYGVPGNMIGQTDKSATYASAEQFQIDFVRHTVRPLAVRLEQVINKALFAKEPGVYCELDLDDLLRGDSKTQAEYLRSLVDGGVMTRNEARHTLNLPERPEADQLTVRSYEIDLNALPKLSQAATPAMSQNDVRKEAPAPLESGFHMHVNQDVLPRPAMKKKGRARRNSDGSMSFEIEEIEDPAKAAPADSLTVLPLKPARQKGRVKRMPDGTMSFESEDN